MIYHETGHYAGWPANYGIWNWDEEIVVGFTVGFLGASGGLHPRDKSRPFKTMQARSLDGGYNWWLEDFPGIIPGNRALSADEHLNDEFKLRDVLEQNPLPSPSQAINFAQPDFALMCARTGLEVGAKSLFYYSENRCQNWIGPYALPDFGGVGIQARTDYLVENANQCLLFLTLNKSSGQEGRVICAETYDGGQSFTIRSKIGDESQGNNAFAIMPASLRLDDNRILCALRCQGDDLTCWIDLYQSNDNAETWHYMNRPVTFATDARNGNPPTLNRLPDGRLIVIYGNRSAPYTIAGRLSEDEGNSWSDEITLRSGGGDSDIGYPRTAIMADGTVVTVYYFNEDAQGERFIEATLWRP